ncbi:hypothetical protein [Ureibacillus aquaedulcis]|uniref:Uncharacterized protein n=1 Tax=Ureibacillus aquaedulcis TaxID=3058421 RepID=A0ABT8GR56_9BACL|nr:hypothetical protein [Ureibacillus sp. BA0131]MDN4493786.1 hypothetical protein [Ureibacillus sp. BA0131]
MNKHQKTCCLSEAERKLLKAEIIPIIEKKTLEEIKLALQLIGIKETKRF